MASPPETPGALSSQAPRGYTWDDFVALEEGDLRELIDGELVEVEVPTFVHAKVTGRILVALGAWAQAGPGGVALPSGYKVRVSEKRGLMPDVQFYRRGNDVAEAQQQGLVAGRADLVVEVVSPSSRRIDRVKKLNSYASLGIPEYWIVDPEARVLERLVLQPERSIYAIAASLSEDDVFRPESFEGLEIPLARLWE